MELKEWKIIPNMERYMINKDGEVRNRFTKRIIFPRKDRNLTHLTMDSGERVTRSPAKLAREIFNLGGVKK